MTEFILYQGKTALVLAVFYMFYRLLLSKETFHRFNRIVLLGTAALSFILPLCVITIKEVVILPYTTSMEKTVETANEISATGTAAYTQPIWPYIIAGVFIMGAAAVLMTTLISIFRVKSILRHGERRMLESGETLIITNDDTAPFSWMKYIVISREDYESGYSQILTHEKAHIALRHSWDLLFVDIITVFQWFNPAIWMLKGDLRALHEFQADDAVLRSGTNIKEYQYLLIRKAVGKSGYSVANSFNHSTLKARITMMLNKKSSRMSAWKALYVIPLVGFALACNAQTVVDYQHEDQDLHNTEIMETFDTPVDKDTKKSFKEKNLHNGRIIVDEENNVVTMVYYGLDGKERKSQITGLPLGKETYFINGSFATPKAFEMAMEKDNDAVLLTAYHKDGVVRGAVSADHGRFVSGSVNTSEPTNTMVVKEGDKYTGKSATTETTGQAPKNEEKPQDSAPSFNGGSNAEFLKWVQANIRYPEGTAAEGQVHVTFTVTETGKIANVATIGGGADQKLIDEAVRTVSSSPDWEPATHEGKPVAIRMIIPVEFKK